MAQQHKVLAALATRWFLAPAWGLTTVYNSRWMWLGATFCPLCALGIQVVHTTHTQAHACTIRINMSFKSEDFHNETRGIWYANPDLSLHMWFPEMNSLVHNTFFIVTLKALPFLDLVLNWLARPKLQPKPLTRLETRSFSLKLIANNFRTT